MKWSSRLSLVIAVFLLVEPVLLGAAQTAPDSAVAAAPVELGLVEMPAPALPAAGGDSLAESIDCSGVLGGVVNLYLPFIARGGASGALAVDWPQAGSPEAVGPRPLAPDASVGSGFASASEFLYLGEAAIQQGMQAQTIDPLRAAVVRGRTCRADGTPLAGVQISVLDHAEYGSTLSQADGMFDLAVNGGGALIVNYARAGYLPAQRQVHPKPRDYAWLPDVVLIQLDSRVTLANLTGNVPMQVARGNAVADLDGARQATLLIPQGTTAQLVMANGSTQPITQLSIRATEYTVGAAGPAAMPGDLPPSSGYTYALEYSVDEGLAAGAVDVQFSQPLFHYVENFLDFPVGMIVPTGYYDRRQGAWLPSANGRVVKVVSVSGGLANLDTTGDGAADNSPALGITTAERQHLAALYSAGQTLWRVPIEHFTPWDCNWPYGPPPGATPPDQPPPINEPPVDKPNVVCGSIMECQNQILRESIPLVGTPFSLHYSSDRVPGRTAAYHLDIPLSGPSLPQGLVRIELAVEVAGRRFTQSLPAASNQSVSFTWNGLDAYGRTVISRQPAAVIVGYTYRASYLAPSEFGNAFSLFSGSPISGNSARQEVTIWQVTTLHLGGWDNRVHGLGGWNLDVHHAYDPVAKVLFLGDGSRRSAQSMGTSVIDTFAGGGIVPGAGVGDGGPATSAELYVPLGLDVGADGSVYIVEGNGLRVRQVDPLGVITTVAGTGALCFPNTAACGDGGPATSALLSSPNDVAVGPDGSLYIADRGNHRIRRVGPDGIITTVAGTGVLGFAGDGGPATAALLNGPYGVDVGPDGSLYIADTHNSRIRKVGPDGIISTLAGGVYGFAGDGGPAGLARLAQPRLVKLGPDGSLYILDYSNTRVRRVGPNGIISTVAGNGLQGFSGDGGPATQAKLAAPHGLAVGPDGSLYIGDQQNYRVRWVGPDGAISTLAGGATNGFSGDGGPATRARLATPVGVTLDAEGRLYVADWFNQRVRRITSALPGFAVSDLLIPSEDGLELYVFNGGGRHLRTLHALTGAVLHEFTYDAGFRLASVTDGSGNTTTIQRAAGGAPTAILGSDGQSTLLTTNANGFLASVTNPAGGVHGMITTAGGLLTALTNPRGFVTTFTYDSLGRLIREQDPAGGEQVLARTDSAASYQVTRSSALGTDTEYHVDDLPGGDTRHLNLLPDGTQAQTVFGADGTRAVQAPDGTDQTIVYNPDPRWGMLAPVEWVTTTLPGALTQQQLVSRTAALSNPANPLSLVALTQTVRVNSAVYTSSFTAGSGLLLDRSPVGRVTSTTLNGLGQPISIQLAGLSATQYAYDSRGRVISQTVGTGPDARTDLIVYNSAGLIASLTNAAGQTTNYLYDAAGRLTSETRPDGQSVTYAYDANGNVTSLTPPGQPAHAFNYTPVDLRASYTPPDVNPGTDATQHSYNADRQLTLVARPDGQTVAYGYNSAGRLATVTTPRGVTTYAYHPATGLVAAIHAPGGVGLALSFDGGLNTAAVWSGPVTGTAGFTYNNDFRLASTSVNGANTINFQHDADGLLTQAGALAVTRSPQNGLPVGSTLATVTTTLGFNGFGEVVSHSAAASGTPLYADSYTRDKLGRITQRVQTLGGVTTFGYGYDLAGRLISVTLNAVSVAGYAYDANGNRLSFTGPGGTVLGVYDDQDRLTSYDGMTFAYGANGERSSKIDGLQTTLYNYDALGNLITVTLPAATTISYLVDGLDRRVGKLVNGARVAGWLYEDGLRPIAELNASNQVVSRFIYASWDNVPDYMVKGGVTYRLILDHTGSPRLVVNAATGAVAQQMDYDAFGRVLTDTNPGFQPFGFGGGLYDPATGLVRLGARDYDAETGTWLARDPLLFEGGQSNLYAYVNNDPVNGRDPTGLQAWDAEIDKMKKPPVKLPKAFKETKKLNDEACKSAKDVAKQGNALKKAADNINRSLMGDY